MIDNTDIAAPPIISSAWKQWNYSEGRAQCQRIIPDNCLLYLDEEQRPFFEKMAGGERSAVPPLTPDQKAWREANLANMPQSKAVAAASCKIAAATQAQDGVAMPRGTSTYLTGGVATTHILNGFGLFQSYFGVAVPAQAIGPGPNLSVWIGMQNGLWLIQPVMQNTNPSGPVGVQNWSLHDEAFPLTGLHPGVVSPSVPFHVPGAVWGVIRYYGGPRYWSIRSYRGAKGNAGPAYGQPLSTGAIMRLADYPSPGTRGNTELGGFTIALVAFEFPSGTYDNCNEVSVTSVWGGLNALDSARAAPIWGLNGQFPGFSCPSTSTVISNGLNGGAQITGVVRAS